MPLYFRISSKIDQTLTNWMFSPWEVTSQLLFSFGFGCHASSRTAHHYA